MLSLVVRRVGFYIIAAGLFMLVMLIAFSLFYRWVEGLSWLDSIYFTVITTRTIGFGDIHPNTTAGKIGTIFNALLPATVFLGASLVVLETMMRSLEEAWRRFVMSRVRDHDILIATADLLESMLREYHATGRRFLVIDRDNYDELPTNLQTSLGQNNYLCGDASRDEVLQQAGIGHARALIIATKDDSYNMYVLVTARALNPTAKLVVRINDVSNTSKFTAVGADIVLPTSTIVGQMLSQAASQPQAHDFMVALHTHTHEPFLESETAAQESIGKPVLEAYRHPIALLRQGRWLYDMVGQVVQAGDTVIRIALRE